jgi:hypothetical protein
MVWIYRMKLVLGGALRPKWRKCAGFILAVFTVALGACAWGGWAGLASMPGQGPRIGKAGAQSAQPGPAGAAGEVSLKKNVANPVATPGQPKNPAVRKLGPDITFYQSCNHLPMVATMSGGAGDATLSGHLILKAGLYGKAMLTGDAAVRYAARGNIDLSRGGSLALWLCADHWQSLRTDPPYIFFLQANDHGRQLLIGRMGVRENHEDLEVYVTGAKKSLCIVPGNTRRWKTRQWHLLVVNWTDGSVAVSLDGRVWQQSASAWLSHLHGPAGQLTLGDVHDSVRERCLVDELLVFDRPLTMREIQWLYRQGRLQAQLDRKKSTR